MLSTLRLTLCNNSKFINDTQLLNFTMEIWCRNYDQMFNFPKLKVTDYNLVRGYREGGRVGALKGETVSGVNSM